MACKMLRILSPHTRPSSIYPTNRPERPLIHSRKPFPLQNNLFYATDGGKGGNGGNDNVFKGTPCFLSDYARMVLQKE